jgi:hypothetical protein
MVAKNNSSSFTANVRLKSFGIFGNASCQSLYAEISFWIIDNFPGGGA